MPETFSLFAQVCVAILLEATPFLLFGSLISGFFEVFVPRESLERFLPRSAAGGVAAGLVLGMLIPCCECGIVPLIRRLLAKGVSPAIAMTFMLAGPVINPVVLASTFVAYRGDLTIVAMRCVLVALVAAVVGLALRSRRPHEVLLGAPPPGARPAGSASPALFGSMDDAITIREFLAPPLGLRVNRALSHAQADFLDMFKILVAGAVTAAAFKVLVPADVVGLLEKDLLLAVTGMMLLAVALSLCSQADAFVAASFSGFPQAAQLAFLALGPVLDIKLVLMWRGAFRPDVVRLLIIIPAVLIFCVSMLLGAYWRMPQ